MNVKTNSVNTLEACLQTKGDDTPHESCQLCRSYYHPNARSQHVCMSHEDEFDDHPVDAMNQYQDYSYEN